MKTSAEHPAAARKLVDAGLTEELARMKLFPKKEMPSGMRKLNYWAMNKIRKALKDPASSCWTNIFAPVEILECFDLSCLSMEALSSFMSGFKIEDHLINGAESSGIAPTMCSYHKNFIGGVDAGIFPPVPFSVTTSLACDGNISTFRHVERKYGVKSYVIDIPYAFSRDAKGYVTGQLKDLIKALESRTGKKFDIDRLRQVIRRENLSRRYYGRYLDEVSHRYYPKTLTLEMFLLFATHLDIGTEDTLEIFRLLSRDVKKYPEMKGKRIFWDYLIPYYQPTLQEYFNYNEDFMIQAMDMNMDYMHQMDEAHPLEALAEKMIRNMFNGPYERRATHVAKLVRHFQPDGVISFCHWGCRQSSGGVNILREEMRRIGMPLLVLDGDAIDRRNSHDGQIKTRLEAFLEMIK